MTTALMIALLSFVPQASKPKKTQAPRTAEIPLQAPVERKPRTEAETPASQATSKTSSFDVGAREDGVVETKSQQSNGDAVLMAPAILGARVLFSYGLNAAAGPGIRVAVEAGYRFPFASRLIGLSLEPAFDVSWSTVLATPARTTGLSVPLLASVNVVLGPGLARALVGPSFEWWQLIGPGKETSIGLGLAAGLGYCIVAGPGTINFDARYSLVPALVVAARATRHIIAIGVGYSFLF